MSKAYNNTNTSEFVNISQNLELENGQPLEPSVANRGVIDTHTGAMMADNCIIVDWLTFASKSWGFDEMVSLLGLTSRTWQKGKASRLHYEHVLQFGHIYIHYTSCDSKKYNPGACCEMSGQGCREFETYSDIDFTRLFQFLYAETYNTVGLYQDITISRLDLAFDDHTGVFDLPSLALMAQEVYFVSPARLSSFEVVRSYKQLDKDKCGLSVMFGSRESPVYVRIYDKRIERQAFDLDHWVRCELQLRKDAASGFIKTFCAEIGASFPLGRFFTSILANYVVFKCPSTQDSNKSRWAVAPFWSRILGDIERVSVFTPKNVEYNLERMERYAFDQNHNHTKSLIEMVGAADYLLALKDSADEIPQKYKTVAAALENGDEILKRLSDLDSESSLHYLRRCRDDINRTLIEMEYEQEQRKKEAASPTGSASIAS